MISATDWSVSRSPVSVVAAAHPAEHRPAVDARGLQPCAERADRAQIVSLARAYGTATCVPACSWSVLDARIVTSRPRRRSKARSSTSSATSSERLSAAANPSKSSARSRRPARVSGSIGSSSRASGSRSSGAARRVGAVPSWRRIPDRTAATAPESHGLGWSWARCAAAIAAARRAIVTGRNSRSASAARNAATVAGVAGIAAQAARRAPLGERAPVALIRPPGRRRERRGGVRGGTPELALDRRRRRGRGGGPWRSCRPSLGSDNGASRYLIRQALHGPLPAACRSRAPRPPVRLAAESHGFTHGQRRQPALASVHGARGAPRPPALVLAGAWPLTVASCRARLASSSAMRATAGQSCSGRIASVTAASAKLMVSLIR